jgi:hypothetical protein
VKANAVVIIILIKYFLKYKKIILYLYNIIMESQHIFAIAVVLIILYMCKVQKENYSSFCGNCHDLTPEQCANCPNCGVCGNDKGCQKCTQGDDAGPYFSDECQDWKYMGKTPNNKCWNYEKNSPLNCGYEYPYNKRVILHQKFAAIPHQLGTKSY